MTYDPYEFMDEAARTDFEVRQHLYAQRRLREIEQIDTKAKVQRMLADVAPGPKVCAMAVTAGAEEGEKAKRKVCGAPATRMIRLTGDWVCPDHDPLGQPYWGEPCPHCGRSHDSDDDQ